MWLYYEFVVNSCNLFTHILQGSFTGTGTIIWLSQCQWSNPEGYGYIHHDVRLVKMVWYQNETKPSNTVHMFYAMYFALSVDCKQDWWNPMPLGPAALATSYKGNQSLLGWRLQWQGAWQHFVTSPFYVLNSFAETLKYIFVFSIDTTTWLNVIVLGDWEGMRRNA